MTYNNGRSGVNNVAEYQASGLPWVTSSMLSTSSLTINFPYVTNFIALYAQSGSYKVGFTANGMVGSNYFTVSGSAAVILPIRCKTLFLSTTTGSALAEVIAGLTTIEAKAFPVLTASATYFSGSGVYNNVFGYGKPGDPGAGTGTG